MEKLINNPNLAIDIGQNILKCLDDASLQTCRLVNKTMKRMVDEPKFWIQKLEKKGLNPQFKSKALNENGFVQKNLLNWRKLVAEVENTELEKNVAFFSSSVFSTRSTNFLQFNKFSCTKPFLFKVLDLNCGFRPFFSNF